MLLLSRVLNTTLIGVLILLGMIWFYSPANAVLVLQGVADGSAAIVCSQPDSGTAGGLAIVD